MSQIRTGLASEINQFHELACRRAGEAIEHAKQAGRLLLEAKGALKHGEWLPWLEQNILVSPRQAQRYMQVAQGRALSLRSIKSDKVSHLEVDAPRLFAGVPDTAEFVPEAGQCYAVVLPDTTVYAVEPSLKHPGYFFVSKMDGATDMVEHTRRPVGAAWVETNLKYYGLKNPAAMNWRTKPSPGVLEALETFPGCTL